MLSPQQYIDQAVAAGIPLGRIQDFLANNVHDEHRILSALGPEYIHAADPVATTTIQPAASPSYATYASPSYATPVYATPTPTSGTSGGLTQASAADSMVIGHSELADNISRPQITINTPGGGAPAAQLAVMPQAFSLQPWMILAALAVVVLVLMRK